MGKIISLKALRERRFKSLAFTGFWKELIGEPEQNFKVLCYGPEKSGKSTLVIKLANYLAENFGKCLYNSHEEGHSKTFQDRIERNNIGSENLFIGHKVSFEDMMSESFRKKYYKFVVIDSLQYMKLTYEQYKQLTERYRNMSFIFISQMNGRGKIKGGTDIAHAVDVKIHCFEGMARVESRFAQVRTIKLFDKNEKPSNSQLKIEI